MYIKGAEAKTKMLDLRKAGARVVSKVEERRMKREKIPDTKSTPKVDVIGRFWSVESLGKDKTDRLRALLGTLTDDRIRRIVTPIISVTADISLRALDWFVINYSRRNKISLLNVHSHVLSIYDDYRSWLAFWKRSVFDAFRRGPRIFYEQDSYVYSTTVAQLNFLYWCERGGILGYVSKNLVAIEQDMNERIAECRKEKELAQERGMKRKRSELCKTPDVKCMIYSVPGTIRF